MATMSAPRPGARKRAVLYRRGSWLCCRMCVCVCVCVCAVRGPSPPVECVKTELQLVQGREAGSIVRVSRRVLQQGGGRGLFQGNVVNCVNVAPQSALFFALTDFLKRKLGGLSRASPVWETRTCSPTPLAEPNTGDTIGRAQHWRHHWPFARRRKHIDCVFYRVRW